MTPISRLPITAAKIAYNDLGRVFARPGLENVLWWAAKRCNGQNFSALKPQFSPLQS